MTNSNVAGIPYVVCTTRHAPIFERLRTVHNTSRRPRRIFPALSMRRRGILRRSSQSMTRVPSPAQGRGNRCIILRGINPSGKRRQLLHLSNLERYTIDISYWHTKLNFAGNLVDLPEKNGQILFGTNATGRTTGSLQRFHMGAI